MVVVDEHCKSSRQERHEATKRPSRTKQCTSAWRKCGFWCQLNQSSAQGLQSKCWNCTSHRAQPERALAAGLREEGFEDEGGKNVHRDVFSAIWTPCTGGPDGSRLWNSMPFPSAPVFLFFFLNDLKYRLAIAIPMMRSIVPSKSPPQRAVPPFNFLDAQGGGTRSSCDFVGWPRAVRRTVGRLPMEFPVFRRE